LYHVRRPEPRTTSARVTYLRRSLASAIAGGDLVDAVQDVVGQLDVGAGEQPVELVGRARADQYGRDRRMRPDEGGGELRQREPRLVGDGGELLDRGGFELAGRGRRVVDRRAQRGPVA